MSLIVIHVRGKRVKLRTGDEAKEDLGSLYEQLVQSLLDYIAEHGGATPTKDSGCGCGAIALAPNLTLAPNLSVACVKCSSMKDALPASFAKRVKQRTGDEEFGHEFHGNQYVEVAGQGKEEPKPKPTKASNPNGIPAKHAIHELLSSGHSFSVKELMEATGHANEKTITSWLSMFKNPKTAGSKGVLHVQKLPDGTFQVMKGAAPAPALKANVGGEAEREPGSARSRSGEAREPPQSPPATAALAPRESRAACPDSPSHVQAALPVAW
jgi:hypothetical protein